MTKHVTRAWTYEKQIFHLPRSCVGGEVHLKVLVPRHNFVGEFWQEHGDECRKAPFRSQLVRADPCQPQHVLRDVRGLALEQSTPVQTQTGRGKTAEARWDGQTHAGEESTPPRRVLILRPLQGRRGRAAHLQRLLKHLKCLGRKVKDLTATSLTDTVQVWLDLRGFYSRTKCGLLSTQPCCSQSKLPLGEEEKQDGAFACLARANLPHGCTMPSANTLRYECKSGAPFSNCTDCGHEKLCVTLRNFPLMFLNTNYSIFDAMYV